MTMAPKDFDTDELVAELNSRGFVVHRGSPIIHTSPVTELWTLRNQVLIPAVCRGELVDITWRRHKLLTVIRHHDIEEKVVSAWWSHHNVGIRQEFAG